MSGNGGHHGAGDAEPPGRLEAPDAPPPDAAATARDRAILEARAGALARPLEPPAAGETIEVIVFRRGDERFAIASSEILEVVRLGAVTPIPGARAPVRGLSARRGEPMVVLDLGTAGEAAAEPAWALALGDPRLALGVAADEIRELVRLRADEIRPPSASLASDRGWARGITTDAVIVIDAAALIRTHG